MTDWAWMDYVFLVITLVIVIQKFMVWMVHVFRFRKTLEIAEESLPTVSILIPARNEAQNLPACLDSLLQLDYPKEKLEILVGDDQSEDGTAALVKSYQQEHGHIHLYSIQPEYHGLVARSNVLAQLAKKSQHKKLVFLDADMQVHPKWLRSMVVPTTDGYNVVSGYTEVKAHDWLSNFQKFDWMNVIMLLKAGADIHKPGTALGNNMLISKKAYDAVGGYEAIGPTFTEDNDITLAAVDRGYLLFQLAVPYSAKTLPMRSWSELCKQRNRWMQGAFKQPLIRLIPLLISRVFVLWVAIASIYNESALGMLVLFTWADLGGYWILSSKVKSRVPFYIAIFAPVFNSLLDTFTLLSYPWNKQVVWKGRKL